MDSLTKFGIGSALGGIGAGAGGMLMGGGNNPYDAAKGSFAQIPGQISPYFNPYINAGQSALPQLQGQFSGMMGNYPGLQNQFNTMQGQYPALQNQYNAMQGQYGGVQNQYNDLMNNPAAKYNSIAGGYQSSPGYNWNLSQGMNAADNAAAAGGMQGSPQHQQQAATMASGLASQDFQNYLNHAMGLYNTGLQGNQNMFSTGLQGNQNIFSTGLQGNQGLLNTGLSGMQGINNQGYQASDTLAGSLANNLMNQGNLAFSGAASQNQNKGTQMGDIMGGLGTLAMFL
jgi:hypothetical protein